jgi:hypothetical protein
MKKEEIVASVWSEVWELEALIKKLQARRDKMKSLAHELDAEIAGPSAEIRALGPDSKFRKVIDKVFGEQPKRKK